MPRKGEHICNRQTNAALFGKAVKSIQPFMCPECNIRSICLAFEACQNLRGLVIRIDRFGHFGEMLRIAPHQVHHVSKQLMVFSGQNAVTARKHFKSFHEVNCV